MQVTDFRGIQVVFDMFKQKYLYSVNVKGFKGNVVNRALPSLQKRSLAITLTVLLIFFLGVTVLCPR